MILTISICAWWFAEGSGLPNYIKRFLYIFDIYYKKDLDGNKIQADKLLPFDCSKCLGFWSGLIYYWELPFINQLINAVLCSAFAIIISKILWRLR